MYYVDYCRIRLQCSGTSAAWSCIMQLSSEMLCGTMQIKVSARKDVALLQYPKLMLKPRFIRICPSLKPMLFSRN